MPPGNQTFDGLGVTKLWEITVEAEYSRIDLAIKFFWSLGFKEDSLRMIENKEEVSRYLIMEKNPIVHLHSLKNVPLDTTCRIYYSFTARNPLAVAMAIQTWGLKNQVEIKPEPYGRNMRITFPAFMNVGLQFVPV